MKALTPEQSNKLQQMEDAFINEKMNRVPEEGRLRDDDFIQRDMLQRGDKTKNDNLAKSFYKQQFCDDLIENFDNKMGEIGCNDLSPDDKASCMTALMTYSVHLKNYNENVRQKEFMTFAGLPAHIGEKSYGDKIKLHGDGSAGSISDQMNRNDAPESEKASEPGEITIEENKLEGNIFITDDELDDGPVELDVNVLQTEDQENDPLSRRSPLESVTKFFGDVCKFLTTGLSSWWTGVPLNIVEEFYDEGKSISRKSLANIPDILAAFDEESENENENENENESEKKHSEPVM
jgi:hypothetical protein